MGAGGRGEPLGSQPDENAPHVRVCTAFAHCLVPPLDLILPGEDDDELLSAEGLLRISLHEVAQHNTEGNCWLVIHGKVYDVTSFLPSHPGGKQMLLQYAGQVADEGFDANHEESVIAKRLGADKLLGVAIE